MEAMLKALIILFRINLPVIGSGSTEINNLVGLNFNSI